MKKIKVLTVLFGISIGIVSLSLESNAKSLGSIVGGILDCPLSGIPCSSDADSDQKQRCRISVGVSLTPRGPAPTINCSE